MKYLKHEPFSVAVGGSSNYEEIFVRCHCACHQPRTLHTPEHRCCTLCPECGNRIKLGMEKRHDHGDHPMRKGITG